MFPVVASMASRGPRLSAAYTRELITPSSKNDVVTATGEPTTGLVNVCFHFNFKDGGTMSEATPVWSGLLRYIVQSVGEATPVSNPIPTRRIANMIEAEIRMTCRLKGNTGCWL